MAGKMHSNAFDSARPQGYATFSIPCTGDRIGSPRFVADVLKRESWPFWYVDLIADLIRQRDGVAEQ